jgi:hypothetical protein
LPIDAGATGSLSKAAERAPRPPSERPRVMSVAGTGGARSTAVGWGPMSEEEDRKGDFWTMDPESMDASVSKHKWPDVPRIAFEPGADRLLDARLDWIRKEPIDYENEMSKEYGHPGRESIGEMRRRYIEDCRERKPEDETPTIPDEIPPISDEVPPMPETQDF